MEFGCPSSRPLIEWAYEKEKNIICLNLYFANSKFKVHSYTLSLQDVTYTFKVWNLHNIWVLNNIYITFTNDCHKSGLLLTQFGFVVFWFSLTGTKTKAESLKDRQYSIYKIKTKSDMYLVKGYYIVLPKEIKWQTHVIWRYFTIFSLKIRSIFKTLPISNVFCLHHYVSLKSYECQASFGTKIWGPLIVRSMTFIFTQYSDTASYLPHYAQRHPARNVQKEPKMLNC